MSRKGHSITLSLKEKDKAELENLAREYGMKWGDRPNISKLVEAIAQRRLLITPNNNWLQERITALKQAIDSLTDAGKVEEALLIANLLLERSELSLPLRAEIERFLGNPPPPWRIELNQYIHREQPFQLSYHDATGRLWNFTVRHAKIVPHEERQYLDCWCEETEGNLDVEELHHNWSLRLDRIPEAGVIPISGKWRSHLDEVLVEMHIHGRLAFAYKNKNEDVDSQLLEASPPARRVIRRVSSTYWFIREVLRDAPDVLIIAPENVCLLAKEKLKTLYQRYNLEISS